MANNSGKSSQNSLSNAIDKPIEKGSELGGAVAGTAAGAAAGAVAGGIAGSIVPKLGTIAGAKAGMKKGADIGAGIGKDVGKAAGQVTKLSRLGSKFLSNPLDALSDKAVQLIVDFFVPVPILGEYLGDVVAKYKGQILMGVVVAIFMFVALMFPGEGMAGTPVNYEGLPEELVGYLEPGFIDSGIPHRSPFGGSGTTNTRITAYYHDPNYYKNYGRWHDAIDIVPNNNYYQNNKAYLLTGRPVMFATCSGTATGKVDQYGANCVIIDCKGTGYTTMFLHNSVNFVPLDETVEIVAGQPIAVMGATGLADGAHVHYAVQKNGVYIDPLPYIQ